MPRSGWIELACKPGANMTSGLSKRKLTTIMAADVVGYSRLVAADDEAAIRRFQQLRHIVESIVLRHDGRPFGAAGDSLMAEFPSSVEAVRCALEIQDEIAARNADEPADRAMFFRIGINIGDVITEGENLFGDGVNVAARLQEIATPGGVVLSAGAYDQIKNKVTVETEPLGQRSLKNIPEPVTIFRVRVGQKAPVAPVAIAADRGTGWRRRAVVAAVAIIAALGTFATWDQLIEPARRLEMFKAEAAQPLPVKPSIIVMPFLNVSENEAQEYFCLGMAEDIMTSLTKVSGLFVVGRDSAMSFKGKPIQAKQIGRELGVRYVLQGSVRRSENQVRISTHLVDAATDQTIWAARYDRELGNIFAIQDDIAENIVQAVAVSFLPGERENLRHQLAQVPQAATTYDLFLQARRKLIPPNRENLNEAEAMFARVIAADDAYAGGHAGLSLVHSLRVSQGFIRSSQDRERALRRAEELARAAVRRDPNSTIAMFALANSALPNRNQDEAVEQATKAYFSQPGDAYYAATLGYMLTFAGKPREAYYPLERAIERERVAEFQARAQFFKLFAAYEAGDYATADQAYADHIKAQGRCFSNCLAYAAASKLRLADMAEMAQQTDQKQRFETEARILATNLTTTYPDYLSRVNSWLAQYKNDADAARFKRDVDRVYALVK